MTEDLESLLPHRAPMILIDEVESFDAAEKRLVARVTITPNQLFFDGEGVPSWVAIEYMAQTAAALVGMSDRMQGRKARVGFLLGTRRLDLAIDRFAAGETYRIAAKCAFEDDSAAAFECVISDSRGSEVATASLNAYRPANVAEFLKEQANR